MQEIRAAGVIIFDQKFEQEILFLLLRHTQGKHWGFPKGRAEPGESVEQTALRELYEEAGIKVPLIEGFLEVMYYPVYNGTIQYPKRVDCFLGSYSSSNQVILSNEHSEYCWVSLPQAKKLVQKESCQKALDQAYIFIINS